MTRACYKAGSLMIQWGKTSHNHLYYIKQAKVTIEQSPHQKYYSGLGNQLSSQASNQANVEQL